MRSSLLAAPSRDTWLYTLRNAVRVRVILRELWRNSRPPAGSNNQRGTQNEWSMVRLFGSVTFSVHSYSRAVDNLAQG